MKGEKLCRDDILKEFIDGYSVEKTFPEPITYAEETQEGKSSLICINMQGNLQIVNNDKDSTTVEMGLDTISF